MASTYIKLPATPSGSGSGDVLGPGSSTTNAFAKFADASGTQLANSGVLCDGSNNLTGINNISIGGTTLLSANPTLALQAATKQYVDANIPSFPVSIANGGTGQSNQQAALNNLTDIGSHTNGDFLILSGGNAQFATIDSDDIPAGATNKYATYAGINAALALPTNVFVAANNSGDVVGYTQWNIDATSKFSNVQLTYQPNNLSAGAQAFTWNVSVDPLQDSPNDSITVHSFSANLDSAATGFDMGTASNSVTLISGGFNYQGNGSVYGRVTNVNLNSNLGNGTDPVSVKGVSGIYVGFGLAANATIDGNYTAFSTTSNLDAASITTSNFAYAAFNDGPQLPVDVYGYQSYLCQPNITTLKNNHNFNGVAVNPTIATFEGNAGMVAYQAAGAITTQGTNGYTGLQVSPTVTHLTSDSYGVNASLTTTDGTANWTAFNFGDGGINTTGDVRGLQINMSSGRTAIEVTGRSLLSANIDLASSLGTVNGNQIGGSITVPDATAITGTDVFGNNMAFGIDTGDATSSWTAASLVGLTVLGYVGAVVGDGAINGPINFCLNGYSMSANGTIDRINNFIAAAIPGGGTAVVDETVLYYGDMPGGAVATVTWGLRIDDSGTSGLHNSLTRLALGTTDFKVSSANVKLDVFNGHLAVGQTTDPAIVAHANAGTGAVASCSGTDVAGSISLTTGSGAWASGVQATLTFDKAFANAPKIVITSTNSNAAAAVVGVYVTKSTTVLEINFASADVAATTYTWDYHCYEAY